MGSEEPGLGGEEPGMGGEEPGLGGVPGQVHDTELIVDRVTPAQRRGVVTTVGLPRHESCRMILTIFF